MAPVPVIESSGLLTQHVVAGLDLFTAPPSPPPSCRGLWLIQFNPEGAGRRAGGGGVRSG